MTLEVRMRKVTAGTYMYTWVMISLSKAVMTCVRTDTEFLKCQLFRGSISPLIEVLPTVQEVQFNRIAETCIQGIESYLEHEEEVNG